MPKPVQITYTDKYGVLKSSEYLEAIIYDPNVEPGIVECDAPGVGKSYVTKTPVSILEHPNKLKISSDLAAKLFVLKNYAAAELENKELCAKLKQLICCNEQAEFYFIQEVLINQNCNNNEKRQMFRVLCDEMNLDLKPIVYFIATHKSYLPAALEVLGARLANQRVGGDSIVSMFFNSITYEHELNDVKLIWTHGGDPNMQSPLGGTFLHSMIANEIPNTCHTVIDFLATMPGPIIFDFAARDFEGKTPLLLAIKTKQNTVVKKLCDLHNDKQINIGLDLTDNESRTPLMLAAALGNLAAIGMLIKIGANQNILDKDGKDLWDYANAPRELVIDILRSIHIEPERDCSAPHNWLYFNDKIARPVTNELSLEQHKRVLISFAPEHGKVLLAALHEATQVTDHGELFEFYMGQLRDTLYTIFKNKNAIKDWMQNGSAPLSRETVLDECLSGQTLVQAFLKRQRESLRPRLTGSS